VDSGLIYGYAFCKWKSYEGWIQGWVDRSYEAAFNVAYLKNLLDERDYWKGQAGYWESQYNAMRSDRDSWKNKYDEKVKEYDELNSTYYKYK